MRQQINLKNILGERGQTQKSHVAWLRLCKIFGISKSIDIEKQIGGYPGAG